MASDGARPQVRRPDRVAPPPSRALNHRRYQNQNHSRQLLFRFRLRTRVFARPQALAGSHSLHTRQAHTHRRRRFRQGRRRLRGVLSGPWSSCGALGPPGQARFWSNLEFRSGCSSAGDGCAIGDGVGVSQQQASLFVHHRHQQQQQAMGEASTARLRNYLPVHLNLLASKSGSSGKF
ncbi:hypothetical protein AHAS_Ahas13G0522200 [Arachis hypogaea]